TTTRTSTNNNISLHDALPICARPGLFHRRLAGRQGIEEQPVGVAALARLTRAGPKFVHEHGHGVSVLHDRDADDLARGGDRDRRSEEHTSELQSLDYLVCRLR